MYVPPLPASICAAREAIKNEANMLIKFLRRWRNKKPGTVAEWPDGAANALLKRGIAEVVYDVRETAMREAAQEQRIIMRKGKRV
jgi:hypothetical protein